MSEIGVVDKLEMAFRSIDDLCSSLTKEQWALPTDNPGWSVQDNLSHIIGTESAILGRAAPEHDPGEKPWVRNPIGAGNEVQVDFRRYWPPDKVLEEFREVSGERIKATQAMSADDLQAESWTPVGQGTVADLLAIRIMDIWVHEQDMRRAVGKPGNLEGPIAEHAFARHSTAMPFVVGKKVAPPDGTTVVFEVTGPAGGTIAVEKQGRANVLNEVPESPTVKLTMDLETFNRLCCGRGDPQELRKSVTIQGDTSLAAQILREFNFMI
ncbi:MAG TPA: maleylpyruvate isomerase family mycothiol-dependent enzyme [Actinomycetota bacterium]|jgi:uncharacterized protein (TIGR03083 family)|nr:maleylpyruvate isomerase family mycothiol-dependent enzyme [Actinomycetota bacterium]